MWQKEVLTSFRQRSLIFTLFRNGENEFALERIPVSWNFDILFLLQPFDVLMQVIRIARILINVTAATRYKRLSFGNTRKVATILKKRKRKRKSLREICPYWFLFSPNAGKYGPEKLRIWTLSTW